jgi:hypothetical protein
MTDSDRVDLAVRQILGKRLSGPEPSAMRRIIKCRQLTNKEQKCQNWGKAKMIYAPLFLRN